MKSNIYDRTEVQLMASCVYNKGENFKINNQYENRRIGENR